MENDADTGGRGLTDRHILASVWTHWVKPQSERVKAKVRNGRVRNVRKRIAASAILLSPTFC